MDSAALLDAAQKGQLEAVQDIAAQGPPGAWTEAFQPRSGDTALLLACRVGHLGIVRFALASGAAPDQRNFEGKTGLMEAAQHSRPEVVTLLLQAGADPDAIKRADWTALMLACTRPHLDTVARLLRAPLRLQLRNKDGWSAFHIACREGHVEVMRLLLDRDADLWRSKSRTGRSCLHTAALHGRTAAVRLLLLKTDLPADEADSCGCTPLMDALRNGHVEVASLLMETHGASISKRDALGRQSIHHVCEAGQLDSLLFLVERTDATRVLLNAPALPSGTRPLHLASKEGQLHLVARLLACGADPTLLDARGRSPHDCASPECRALLESSHPPYRNGAT